MCAVVTGSAVLHSVHTQCACGREQSLQPGWAAPTTGAGCAFHSHLLRQQVLRSPPQGRAPPAKPCLLREELAKGRHKAALGQHQRQHLRRRLHVYDLLARLLRWWGRVGEAGRE